MRHYVVALLILTACAVQAHAQLGLGFGITLDDETVPDGWYIITLRYYARSTDPVALAEEDLPGRFIGGRCIITGGLTVELPVQFRTSTTSAIGYSIDGQTERQPRLVLSTIPYAMLAERALIADALSPEFTGLVTSINEIAGPITLLGTEGIRVDRTGSTLTITSNPIRARGTIQGTNTRSEFTITPGVALTDRTRVITRLVNSATHIDITWDINTDTGTITVRTAAPLLDSERIAWELWE